MKYNFLLIFGFSLSLPVLALDTTCGPGTDKLMIMIGFQSLRDSQGVENDRAVKSLFKHAEDPAGMKAKMCERGWGVNVVHGDQKKAGNDKPVSDPVGYLHSQLKEIQNTPCNKRPKQLLLNVLAHGNALEGEDAWKTKEAHYAIVGRDANGTAIKLNMKDLANKIKPLNTGCEYPKIALMDMSCGSAQTLVNFAEAGINDTCILTGAPSNGYASVRSTDHLNWMFGNLDRLENNGITPTLKEIYKGLITKGELTDIPKISGCTERKFDDSSENKWLNSADCDYSSRSQLAYFEAANIPKEKRVFHHKKNLTNFDAVAKFYYRENTVDCIKTGGCSKDQLAQVIKENQDKFVNECSKLKGKEASACKLDSTSKALTATKASIDQTEKILKKIGDKVNTLNDLGDKLSQSEMDYVKELCFSQGSDKCDGKGLTVSKALMKEEGRNIALLEGVMQSARLARLDECIQLGKGGTKACTEFEL